MKKNILNEPIQPKGAIGYPSRELNLDVFPGFQNPPRGYGQIPFYWWVGDKLEKDRLIWQLDKLKEKGITGVQINYPHFASMPDTDRNGWPTCPGEPEVLSEDWWELWSWYVGEVKKRDMAVGLSDYTIHWENSPYYMENVVNKPNVQGTKLNSTKTILNTGEEYIAENANEAISIIAYKIDNGQMQAETGIDLKSFINEDKIKWVASGEWAIVKIWGTPTQLDPMNPLVGQAIVEHYLKPFEDKNPGESGKALNYFFQDEERMRGEEIHPWNCNFAEYFKSKKGYDVTSFLSALFEDIGDISPKIRLDYHDIKAELIGDGYFKPIFEWSWKHGMIFGADNNGRGLNPDCYGDYFRTQRFITAPGNDTPDRSSDLIKEKVNSSIAHLYQRPRVWLEGYHSSGWGTTLESITAPTSENFVFGANILNLHGLYYSTHGGWWEWAPPDFHFRMPYWEHEGAWLKYYERLSYLMSQGYHRCDVAMMYPVSSLESNLYIKDENGKITNNGYKSVNIAFEIGRKIVPNGIDFDFIDFESVENSEVENGKLNIAGEQYRVLILPAMQAIRKNTIEKALEHYRAGGVVISVGVLPSESDRIGRNDEKLDEIIKEIFGKTASELQSGITKNVNNNGGVGIYTPNDDNISELISEAIERDFVPLNEQKLGYVNHHKIGNRDVYMVRNVPKNSECFFKATGRVELWNPWDGTYKSIYTFKPAQGGTIVKMPMESYQDNIIVFTPHEQCYYIEATDMDSIDALSVNEIKGYAETEGEKYANVSMGNKTTKFKGNAKPIQKIEIDGTWDFELKPTLDNQWGDFRLPATKDFISAEARFFSYKEEKEPNVALCGKDCDDSDWERVTYSKATAFWKVNPKVGYNAEKFESELSIATTINANTIINDGLNDVSAKEYDYSIRWGITDSSIPEQNWHHGLNCVVPNEFLTITPKQDTFYWTTVYSPSKADGKILTSETKPQKVWINGVLQDIDSNAQLTEGDNTVLVKYSNNDDVAKRAYFIIEDISKDGSFEKYPLAMDWFARTNIYKFNPYPQINVGVYRFNSPIGISSMKITAYGNIEVWANGDKAQITNVGNTLYGATQYNVTVKNASKNAVKVAIRIEQKTGYCKGAAIPEPILLDCIGGQIELGDWSNMGILESYSGGAWYRKKLLIPKKGTCDKIMLNLGKISATAEVLVNGQSAGILVCPPWKLDITEFAKKGENNVEILVYNTLSNHYSTIPSRYSNFPKDAISGLIGPVSIDVISPVVLKP